jgi:hypothetical protein
MRPGDEYDEFDRDDLELATNLLAGFTVRNKQGLPMKAYYKGRREEKEPRRALARLLRSRKPLSSSLRESSLLSSIRLSKRRPRAIARLAFRRLMALRSSESWFSAAAAEAERAGISP